MANEKNLIPQAHVLTVEEASKGGKASVKARRDKKKIRDNIKYLVEMSHIDKKGNKKTGAELVAIALFNRAVQKGDLQAIKEIIEMVEPLASTVETENLDALEAALFGDREGDA